MKKAHVFILFAFLSVTNSNAITIFRNLSYDEALIYNKYRDVIDYHVRKLSEEKYMLLQREYMVFSRDSIYLADIIRERENHKFICNYMNIDAFRRIDRKAAIDSFYQEIINKRLLPANTSIAGPEIGFALRKAKNIGLNKEQYEKIEQIGLEVANRPERNMNEKDKAALMDTLRNIMTKEQLVQVLRMKNFRKILSMVENAWKEAVEAETVSADEKEKYTSAADAYYDKVIIIQDMYIGHDDIIRKNIESLRRQKPILVRIVEALHKRKEAEANKTQANEIDSEMEW